MRYLVVVMVLAGCGDKGGGDGTHDAAIDAAPIDARYSCLSASECTGGGFCCFSCSPGGACDSDSSCVAPMSNACSHTLCDPLAAGPCMTAFGTTGTCMEVELSMFDHRKVWACH